jgi:hypothetical protein
MNASFCLDTVPDVSSSVKWRDLQVSSFDAIIPSFRPASIPFVETGVTSITITSAGGRGRLRSDGAFAFVVHAQAVNELFTAESPAQMQILLRGKIDRGAKKLSIRYMRYTGATPSNYSGPIPQ